MNFAFYSLQDVCNYVYIFEIGTENSKMHCIQPVQFRNTGHFSTTPKMHTGLQAACSSDIAMPPDNQTRLTLPLELRSIPTDRVISNPGIKIQKEKCFLRPIGCHVLIGFDARFPHLIDQ